ncbi:DUF1631 domain-containing protein [Pseudomaricurvus alcaniphilus]|uniref:DUF1631 family protein n=1 Tax=Pseudomaricurvus alcaniphilus TaxID=1166482 RepID=UPI0014083D46|nr:DUF1631 family protein [Pseudomaricurvus alcaniphilus]NHN37647.1 DUF1631 domain-containing protein [Pseudomaricurvus alcaniphilus]
MSALQLPTNKILKGHTQSLFQALRLLNELDLGVAKGARYISPLQLLELVSELDSVAPTGVNTEASFTGLQRLLLQQPKALQIEPQYRAALLLVDSLLQQLWRTSRPHPNLCRQLQSASLLLGCRLLLRPDHIINFEHPLALLLQELFEHLSTWAPAPGRAGRQLPEWLADFATRLRSLDINNREEVNQQLTGFRQLRRGELARAQAIEARILQREMAAIDIKHAQRSVLLYIDQRLAGRPLPTDIASFIKSPLVGDLQYLVINHGIDAPAWRQWQRLLQVLSWAFPQTDSSAASLAGASQQRKKIDTLLPALMEQLDDSYYRQFSTCSGYEDFFRLLIHYFIEVLQGHTPSCIEFAALDETKEVRQAAVIDQLTIRSLEQYQPQHWFLFSTKDGQKQAGKLLYKEARKDCLVFSAADGSILSRYTFEEFSNALALKLVTPLKPRQLYRNCLAQALQQLQKHYQQKQQDRTRQQQATAERQQAAEKAAREAQELQRRSAPAAPREPLSSSDHAAIQKSIIDLNCGSWLLLSLPAQAPVQIKLSVKLQTAEKYIFTDRVGHRVAEYSLNELVQLVAADQLQILSRGKDFENSLETIVRGLRKNHK